MLNSEIMTKINRFVGSLARSQFDIIMMTGLQILTQCTFQSVLKLFNFVQSSAPFLPKKKRMLGVNRCVCLCVCVHVVLRGFQHQGSLVCSLLWCNTGATDKSKLMNGKLLLMIVKTLLSPHVVLGHLSAPEMDLQVQNTLAYHTR